MKVELFAAILDKLEYISAYRQTFVCLHLFHDFADESMMGSIFLHTDDAVTPT